MKRIKFLLPLILSVGCLTGCNNTDSTNTKKIILHYGDNIISVENVKEGEQFQKPQNPTSASHNFVSWYYNPAFSSGMSVSFPLTIVDDIDLYAQWKIKTITITYYVNNDWYEKLIGFVNYGDFIRYDVQIGKKQGYTFECWCSDAECKVKYNFANRAYSDTTLYARWKQDKQ